MSQRNHPCDDNMLVYFGPHLHGRDFNYAGVVTFQCQLRQCMISTMIWIKQTIEGFRSSGSDAANNNDDNHTSSNPLGIFHRN